MNNYNLFAAMDKALKSLLDYFGEEIFENYTRFMAGLNDMATGEDATRVKNLLRLAVCDLHAYRHLKSGDALTAGRLAAQMSKDFMLPTDISEGVIDCLARLLGLKTNFTILPPPIPAVTLKPAPIKPIPKAQGFAALAEHGSKILNPPRQSDSHVFSRPSKPHITEGGKIRFGYYDWLVLEVHRGKALLLSETVITTRRYHHKSQTPATWEESTLRQYLNQDFYNSFTPEEKQQILTTNIPNTNNPWYNTRGGSGTADKIFLLNIEEAIRYMGDSGQLYVRPDNKTWRISDRYSESRKTTDQLGQPAWWWLRSPGQNLTGAAFVSTAGHVIISGRDASDTSAGTGGVRPAVYVEV